jgi:cytidylate kinase
VATKINIAIDGPAGVGKSSTARAVAERLDYLFIDSGAMYRAVTLFMTRHGINPLDSQAVEDALMRIQLELAPLHTAEGGRSIAVYLNKEDVTDQLHAPEVAQNVSAIASIGAVRTWLLRQQRRIGRHRGVVMDGRDIGTVVFPDAELKVFFTADLDVRTQRRQAELARHGQPIDFATLKQQLADRDGLDASRSNSPLRKAEDAWELDTTHLSLEEQIATVCDWAQQAIAAKEQATSTGA